MLSGKDLPVVPSRREGGMHSIKNISEKNKIDTQSRADAYIRRKRLMLKLKSGCT
jgi:hypothetical protein